MIYFTMKESFGDFIEYKNSYFSRTKNMVLIKAENIEKVNEITQSCADYFKEEIYVHFYKVEEYKEIRPSNFVEFYSLKKGDMFSFDNDGYENSYKNIKISDTEYMLIICPEYDNEQKYKIFYIENKNDMVFKIER